MGAPLPDAASTDTPSLDATSPENSCSVDGCGLLQQQQVLRGKLALRLGPVPSLGHAPKMIVEYKHLLGRMGTFSDDPMGNYDGLSQRS